MASQNLTEKDLTLNSGTGDANNNLRFMRRKTIDYSKFKKEIQ